MARFFLCALAWFGVMSSLFAADDPFVKFSVTHEQLEIELQTVTLVPGTTLFLALRAGNEPGSAVVPFGENFEGSTVFLPFQADRLCIVQIGAAGGQIFERRWEKWKWSDRRAAPNEVGWDAARSVL